MQPHKARVAQINEAGSTHDGWFCDPRQGVKVIGRESLMHNLSARNVALSEDEAQVLVCPDHQSDGSCSNCVSILSPKTKH